MTKQFKKTRSKGFTLIELLLVIAILGILAAVIIVGTSGAQASARDARRQNDLSQTRKSLQAYRLVTGGYPTTDSSGISLEVDSAANGTFTQAMKGSGYMSIIPKDPRYVTGGDYTYKYIATTSDDFTLCAKSEAKGGYICTSQDSSGVALVASAPMFGGWEGTVVIGVAQISTGNYSCAVKIDGTAWCWGMNSYGQLGNGGTLEQHAPVQVVGQGGTGTLANVRQISAGYFFTCALKTDDTVWCWGDNNDGELGNYNTIQQHAPVQVVGQGGTGTLANVDQISAGSSHSCALKTDGTVWCWGINGNGQMGDGQTTPFRQTSPVQALFP